MPIRILRLSAILIFLCSVSACKSTKSNNRVAGVNQPPVAISEEPVTDDNPYFVDLKIDLPGNETREFDFRPDENEGATFDERANSTRVRLEYSQDGEGVTMLFEFEGREPQLLTYKEGMPADESPRILVDLDGQQYSRLESSAIQITRFEDKGRVTGSVEARIYVGDSPRLLTGNFSLPVKKK